MRLTTSMDGTRIAFEESGSGPAIVLIGGSLADHRFYAPLARALEPHFSVYNLDRRGRGRSGDTRTYAPEREVEDVAAVLELTNGPACLYGHSAGAALALRAAAAGLPVKGLALADPPYSPLGADDDAARAEHAEQSAHIRKLNDTGDLKGSARLFLSGFGLAEDEIETMLHSPAGEGMIENARSLPYDYAMLGDGLVPTAVAAEITVRTLVLAPASWPETAQQLAQAIPKARFVAMESPTHEIPPEVLVPLLTGFFKSS